MAESTEIDPSTPSYRQLSTQQKLDYLKAEHERLLTEQELVSGTNAAENDDSDVLQLSFDNSTREIFYLQSGVVDKVIALPTKFPKPDDFFYKVLLTEAAEYVTTVRRKSVIITTGRRKPVINAVKLRKLILASFCDGDTVIMKPFVERAVRSASLFMPNITRNIGLSEMYLQHSVYAVISDLFAAFGIHNFRSNQTVKGLHMIRQRDQGNSTGIASCMPDGAVTLNGDFGVKAMMELKAHGKLTKEDESRCLLMAVMTLLSIDKVKPEHVNYGAHGIAIPFIIAVHDKARLYVARIAKTGEAPTVELIARGVFNDSNSMVKTKFISLVAVLLWRISTFCNRIQSELNDAMIAAEDYNGTNVLSTFSKRGSETDGLSNRRGNKRSNQERGANNDGNETTRGYPKEHEEAAKMVASANGRVTDLKHPWQRIIDLNASAWQREMNFFQQKSPFYFKGYLDAQAHQDPRRAVFCKVWRDGDGNASRNDIKDEIEYFKRAHVSNVPTPEFIEDLTSLDVDYHDVTTGHVVKYHLLVTIFETSAKVVARDLLDYSMSLVDAVLKLHSIGVLHCDIKPRNVLWVAEKLQVLLIDFGHAQDEVGASSYHSTKGYQAPEISRGMVHTRESDAFSVGKTLEEVLASIREHSIDEKWIRHISAMKMLTVCLVHDTVSDRISLETAKSWLNNYTQGALANNGVSDGKVVSGCKRK